MTAFVTFLCFAALMTAAWLLITAPSLTVVGGVAAALGAIALVIIAVGGALHMLG